MKILIFISILFCIIVMPAYAELTDADLNKIRLIVNEEVKTEIAAVKQELKAEIAAVKQELKVEIAAVNQELKAEITKSEKNTKEYIDLQTYSLDKRLSTYNWVIYVLTPLVVAAVGIPSAIMAWRSGKDRALERQVEMLTQEIETLKQQKIISP